jgi:hypothetical protein
VSCEIIAEKSTERFHGKTLKIIEIHHNPQSIDVKGPGGLFLRVFN